MQRLERYFIPEEALREALLNALCHKQYRSGVPIQISVYAEKLGVSRKSVAAWSKHLKEEHIIERIGPPRNGYWKIIE